MKSGKKFKTNGKLGVLPHRVVDLMDYQADAVVSGEILKAKTGTVTLFPLIRDRG